MMAVVAIALFASTDSMAQDRRGKGDRERPTPEMVVKHLDADKDGKISKAEAENAERDRMKEHFDRIDANSDGFIDANELQTAHERRREKGDRKRD